MKKTEPQHPIAIIGMGCIFPRSRNLKGYWNLLFNGIDAIEPVPKDTHWSLDDYFDPDPATPDHTYCKRGGFLPQIAFNPLAYGMPPNNLEATDTSQLLGLEVARMALEDAGYPINHPVLQQKRVNVILGVTGTQELVIPLGSRLGHPIWKKALKDSGISTEKQAEVIDRIQGGYVQWQENSFPGLLGNVVAGRIANRLNLSGTNSATDAACASSLSAIHTAVMELMTGKCDISITGGSDTLNDIFMHICFSKTGVLSHSSDAKPFSKDADGTVLGEGIGMLVLKRLADAQKDNDRIYAVIKGVGTSSDGRTSAVYAPDADGQLKALTQAYTQAHIQPDTVELIEAHGTGTRVGDKVEFDALKRCFSPAGATHRIALGSVKSMIGHTKAAAGAAGMIKSVLALYNKVLPPTLKAQDPDPDLKINDSCFYLNDRTRPWVASAPRRSGVSAFGFGGSNFHVVLEEYTPLKTHVSWDGRIQIFSFSGKTEQKIREQIHAVHSRVAAITDAHEKQQMAAWCAGESRKHFSSDHAIRLLLVHQTQTDILADLTHAKTVLDQKCSNANAYFASGAPTGKLGFLFPGQGSQYTGMARDLISMFPEALDALEKASTAVFESYPASGQKPLQDYIFPPPAHVQPNATSENQLRQTDIAQPAIGAISLAMIKILKRFGITPDVTCGHSFGELSALYSAGWMDEAAFLKLSAARGKHMAHASLQDGDTGSMLAVKAPLEKIRSLIHDEKLDLVLANENSPDQGVLSGPTHQIDAAKKICRKHGMTAVKLPVAAAFHSRFVETAAIPFQEDLTQISFSPTAIPVLSNTTGKYYEKTVSEIKATLGNQLLHPVKFVDNLETMVQQGVSVLLEVGPKSVLNGLARSALKHASVSVLSMDASCGKKSGIDDLAHTLCQIAAQGYAIDLTQWEDPVQEPVPQKMNIYISGANLKPRSRNPVTTPANTGDTILKPSHRTESSRPAVSTAAGPRNDPSPSKGAVMTFSHKKPEQTPGSLPASNAMQLIQKGLEAIQQLQSQTARTHEKFLETQAQASKTLAGIMEQTRHMAFDTAANPPAAHHRQEPVPSEIQQQETVSQPVADALPEQSTDSAVMPILFDIVSRLTGFPVEMLEPDMDIESDLGIDSIKKVEIISELEKQIPGCSGLTSEHIGTVRTLQDICHSIEQQDLKTPQPDTQKPETSHLSDLPGLEEKTRTAAASDTAMLLMDTISELTGFPVEMLEPSMNLESDLGIDSIKRVEILSRIEQQLDHINTISSDDIAHLKTIEEIIQYLTKNQQQEQPRPGAKKKTPHADTPDKKLTRQVVKLKKYPTNQIRFYNGAKIELPEKKTVYITQDSSQIAEKLKAAFNHLGITAQVIDMMDQSHDLSDAAGLVILPDAFHQTTSKQALDFLRAAFMLAQKAAPYLMKSAAQKGAFLATLSFMGGGFGFTADRFQTHPIYGGIAGLAKTADIEWKNVLCHALDLPDDPALSLENAEAAVSLMLTHGSVEMGLDGDDCNIPALMEQDITDNGQIALTAEDVVVITGGAKGVTAACAIELARTVSPTLILVGRSPAPGPEPDWARDIVDPAALKKAILENEFSRQKPKPADLQAYYQKIISERQIKTNMALMESYGSRVAYFSGDIKSPEDVDSIFKSIQKEFSQITAVIHGAGVVEDKRIVDKQIDQFNGVLDTKVKGLEAFTRSALTDQLKYLILFSSVAARSGNQGQCDYAIANEVLNKTAQALSRKHPHCRVLSINWGPWEGGMVDASLKKEFQRRKIELIPLQAGARQFIREMGLPAGRDPEVIIGAHLTSPENLKDPRLSKALSLDIGTEKARVLQSHKIDGKPVVPMALIMEYHAHAAEKNNPGLICVGMDNMRLLRGMKPEKAQEVIHVNLGKCTPMDNRFHAMSTITNSEEPCMTHSSCTLILKEQLPSPPVLSKSAFMELKPYPLSVKKAYQEILFHGPDLQGIQAINGYSTKGIEVVTRLAPHPENWFSKPFHSKWIIDPMMVDAAFQAAILWTHAQKNQVCLPSFLANFKLYSTMQEATGKIRIQFIVNEETPHKISGYFTFLDEKNVVVASITGFEAITDPSLKKKFKPQPLYSRKSILAFAQGNPSEAFGKPYAVFDNDRQIARLPQPPYFFMDRVIKADHPQWEMKPGGWIEAEYDIPPDEWYFGANRSRFLPYAVLLEIALQPCGWLAAYAGSALESEERLYFRNLGGNATLSKTLDQNAGTVVMRSRMKEVSKAGGMIIQDFDFEVIQQGAPVFSGTTNFGFFTKASLANQVGIRNSRLGTYQLPEQQKKAVPSFQFSMDAPVYPGDPTTGKNTGMPASALRMFDEISVLDFEGGLYQKGYLKAIKTVNPSEWFFDAHFYQDPVCPGSLGIESFLQMLRFFLIQKFEIDPQTYEPLVGTDTSHEWIYRGQIVPANKKIEVHAHIKAIEKNKQAYQVVADGALVVDGICIYEMKNYGVAFKKAVEKNRQSREKQLRT